MSTEETKARIVNALRAMMAIGFSLDKAKPVLNELMKRYGQNWVYIEKDNYRVFTDAMFQRDNTEAAEGSKKIVDSEAVEHSNKVGKSDLPVKRLRQENPPPDMPKMPIITPKDGPNELTQTCLPIISDDKSKEIQPVYPQTLSVAVRLKEPNIDSSIVLAPRMKSFSNHTSINLKEGQIAQAGRADHKRKRQPNRIDGSQALEAFEASPPSEQTHKVTPERERVEPANVTVEHHVQSETCEGMSVRLPDWFLEYMKVVTPNQKKIESMPSPCLLPIRAWTSQIDLMTKNMGVTEKIQFGTANMRVALGCLVKAGSETAQLEAQHKGLLEEHRTCPGLIKSLEVKVESLKTMVAAERKHALLIKAAISRKDKEIDELKKKVEAQAARWQSEFVQAKARMKVMQAEAYAKGKEVGEAGFRKSDIFNEFVKCACLYSCGETLKMFERDESVANMKAYIEMKKKEFGLVPTDIDDEEGDMRRTKMTSQGIRQVPRPTGET